MGHIKPKRKVCYQTADGTIHKSKKEAEFHINCLVSKLRKAKIDLKLLVNKQKENKKRLAQTIEHYRQRLLNGYGTPWNPYVCWRQHNVALTADSIRYAERNVQALKKSLRGK